MFARVGSEHVIRTSRDQKVDVDTAVCSAKQLEPEKEVVSRLDVEARFATACPSGLYFRGADTVEKVVSKQLNEGFETVEVLPVISIY